MITPLVLAAGASSRMGEPKGALPFGERSALERILDVALELELAPPVVVVGAHRQVLEPLARRHPARARVIHHPGWAEGRSTSIQAGLTILSPLAAAVLLWPVDVCLVGADVVEALLQARDAAPAQAAWIPSHEGRRGHPALLDVAQVVPRLRALDPDQPARDVVRALATDGKVTHVEVDEPAVRWNMNTPEDYQAQLRAWRARG